MDIHPIFHVSLLEPVHNDPLLGQVISAPEPIIVKGKPEYEVQEVLDSHLFRHQVQYLIKWQGWDILTCEYATKVNKLKAIDNFHAQHPNKLGPLLEDLN
jgi:hypothetical protein